MSKGRKSIPKRIRYAVLERDGYRCRYCGASANDATLHVDHRMPLAKGGSDAFANLVTACSDCNLGKHAFLPITHIAAQRENALAAMIFQRTCERFGSSVPLWEAFCLILDFCLSQSEPEYLLRIMLDAESYEDAKAGWFRFAGYPEPTGDEE